MQFECAVQPGMHCWQSIWALHLGIALEALHCGHRIVGIALWALHWSNCIGGIAFGAGQCVRCNRVAVSSR
jgi:hypothetical protein